jgi:glycosyltransferase involved in cell wall biosynthesis
MRVLLLAQWYPPIIGGEELHVRNLATELARRGHVVTVATLAQKGLPESESHDGVDVIRLRASAQRLEGLFSEPNRQSAAPIADPELVIGLRNVLRHAKPDVMHAHNWIVHSALPLGLAHRAPLLLSLHDFSRVCATKVLMRQGVPCSGPRPIKCLVCAAGHYGAAKGAVTTISNAVGAIVEGWAVAGFLPVSNAVAQGSFLQGLPHRVIPNFVSDGAPDPTADVDPYLAQLPSEPFLLFVGALGRIKGVHVLLDAYRRLRDAPPLVMIGYPMRDTEDVLADLPPNVHLLGQWPPSAVRAAWRQARLGIVPSICPEACPTVIIEAMRAGVPVVSTRIGGIPDLVVDGETGVLVPPADVEALASAISTLLANEGDAARLSAAALARSATFTADAVVPRFEAAYREVIATGTLGSPS